MTGNRDADEFDDDEADGAVEGDADVEHIIKDLDAQKRRGAPKGGEPAWRRLEKYMERKRTAELVADFEDYEIDEPGDERPAGRRGTRRRR